MRNYLSDIPKKPGVYLMRDSSGKIIYIGKAKDLKARISSYFSSTAKMPKIHLLVNRIKKIDYIVASSEREALIIEDTLVKKHQPFYNTLLRDDKSYPYLKLTMSEKYPRLVISREPYKNFPAKITNTKDEFYGPYPNTNLKSLLLMLTNTFKLKVCNYTLEPDDKNKHKYNSCIYLQTKKCSAPCVGKISQDAYNKNVRSLKIFLKYGTGRLEKKLLSEMKTFSDNLEFEKAAQVKIILDAIKNILMKVRFSEIKISDIDIDIATTNTEKLKNLQRTIGLTRFPANIECIDISNLGTDAAVGAVVRFHLGEPDKSNYRKFKIKNPLLQGRQNDFAMISEIVQRRYGRLLRENQQLPDLVIIDGGKGHLTSAIKSLKELDLINKIDIISISKSPAGDIVYSTSREIKLPPDDSCLLLLQQIRDESHRFAIAYHRKLMRQKNNEKF